MHLNVHTASEPKQMKIALLLGTVKGCLLFMLGTLWLQYGEVFKEI